MITLFLLLLVSSALANHHCYPSEDLVEFNYAYQPTYSYLYSSMEKSLKTNTTLLDQLQNGFMSAQKTCIHLTVGVQVTNGTDVRCPDDAWDTSAFCPSESWENKWNLCSPLEMEYTFKYEPIVDSILWLSTVHGT